ncbi:hypothetical protein MKX03_033767 [Papaver bracteatum]|nr:hypothetical protein MKX03_033767 [Papaver bracteatum]
MKRKVEEICLYIECPSTSSILPLSFFTCDSLNLLDLRFGIRTVTKFIIPNTVYFPKLKILRLECLSFVDGTSPNKLFSNCPILEELSLRFCAGFQNEVLWIANPTLKQLYIGYCCFGESAVKICAPNLSTMILRQMRPDDFVVDSFSSLVEADINLLYVSKFPIKLFKKLSNVKLLKMSGVCFPVQSEADILLTDLPAFNNLIHLEVRSRYYCTGLASDSISVMRRFFRFLQLSPNLESIVFAQSIHILGDEDDGCWSLDPKYSLPHLKSIKVKYFNGEPTELNAIKLFLKYLSFLETVTIVASPGLSKDHGEQTNAMKLLLMFPKPAKCVVKFLTSSEKA